MPFVERLITPVIEVEGTAVEELMLQAPYACKSIQFSSVSQSCPALCNPMNHSTSGLPVHEQLPRSPPKPMSIESVIPSSISSSVVPFSSCLQSFPASRSFQISQLFASDGQSIGISASTSVLPMNTQD